MNTIHIGSSVSLKFGAVKRVLFLVLAILCTRIGVAQDILYVNVAATGENNGTSWFNAYNNLSTALGYAQDLVDNHGHTVEIWVSAGIYTGSGAGDDAFTMHRGVSVYGGFLGYESYVWERDFENNLTILNGEHHKRVLYGAINPLSAEPLASRIATWDGFTICWGDSTGLADKHGVAATLKGNAFLKNCIIFENKGISSVYIDHSEYIGLTDTINNLSKCKITTDSCMAVEMGNNTSLDSCTITIMKGEYALKMSGAKTLIAHSHIINNEQNGVYLDGGSIQNCFISNNKKNGVYTTGGTIIGCVIANNGYYGIQAECNADVYLIDNTIVRNGSHELSDCGGVKLNAHSKMGVIFNTILWGNRNNTGNSIGSQQLIETGRVDINYTSIEGGHVRQGGSSGEMIALYALESDNRGYDRTKKYPFFLHPTIDVGYEHEDGNWESGVLSSSINTGNGSFPVSIHAFPPIDNARHYRIWDELSDHNRANDVIDRGAYEYQRSLEGIIYPDNIIYVTEGGAGFEDGTSWNNAIGELNDAVEIAFRKQIPQVWVAKGHYYGDGIPSNAAFYMLKGVKVYGGLNGVEARDYNMAERDLRENISIMDGGNVQRVLCQAESFPDNNANFVDGFQLQNGHTYLRSALDLTPYNANGAGVYMMSGGKISNCNIIENTTTYAIAMSHVAIGGGVYSEGSSTILNCRVSNNLSTNRCGGIYAGAGTRIINTVVSNNESDDPMGVAIYLNDNSIAENVTVVNNAYKGSGTLSSAIELNSAGNPVILRNAIVWGNSTDNQISENGQTSHHVIEYSAIQGGYNDLPNVWNLSENNNGDDAGVFYARFAEPVASKGVIAQGHADYQYANWSLKSTSDCIDRGTARLFNSETIDLSWNARRNGVIDLGAYEFPILYLNGRIIYVSRDGKGDGSSWTKSCGDLNYAVKQASIHNMVSPDDGQIAVWVKKGIYYGDGIPCNPAFLMKAKTNVYGGFVGNEPANFDLNLRNITADITALDGQGKQRVLLQDGWYLSQADGGTTFFFGFDNGRESYWDGFYIQNGYTRCDRETPSTSLVSNVIAYYRNRGAGVYLQKNGFLNNCHVINNRTTRVVPTTPNADGEIGCNSAVLKYEGWGAGAFLSGESVLYNCVFNGNKSASRTGGIYIDWRSTLLNCVITNNESYSIDKRGGAGVYAFRSKIFNTTITNNILLRHSDSITGDGGAGAFLFSNSSINTDTALIENSIIWGNIYVNGNDTTPSQIGINNPTADPKPYIVDYNAIQGGYTGVGARTHNIILDADNDGDDVAKNYPRFIYPRYEVGALGEYDENARTNWSLRITSPCIGIADEDLYPDLVKYATDVANNPRKTGDRIDIGANEYTFFSTSSSIDTIYVTQVGSGDGSSWLNSFGDLQTAIDTAAERKLAHPETDFQIWLAEGEYYGDLVSEHNGFIIRDGVNMYGGFSGTETELEQRDPANHETILSGCGQQRVIYQEDDFEFPTVLSDITISGGYVNGENGGGAFIRKNCTLENCNITGNIVENGIGGGVYADDGAQLIVSRISNNRADDASAAFLVDSVSLVGCTISGNEVNTPDGFTIVVDSASTLDSSIIVSNIGNGVSANHQSKVIRTQITANSGTGAVGNNNSRLVNLLISNNGNGGIRAENNSFICNNTVVNNLIPEASATSGAGINMDSCILINTIIYGNKKGDIYNQSDIRHLSTARFNFVMDEELTQDGTNIKVAESNKKLERRNSGSETGKYYPFFKTTINGVGHEALNILNANWNLLPGTSFYNAGTPTIADLGLPATDLDGYQRVSFGVIDVGAYETHWGADFVYGIIFVKEGGAGSQTGISWSQAMPTIQGAVQVAETMGLNIWVAKGNYYGDTLSPNAFTLGNGVQVYGGFKGDEFVLYDVNQRNLTQNISYLNGQNKHRVLYQEQGTATSLWSGFTIRNGYAASDNENGDGGGVYLQGNSIIDNLNIINNAATRNGGGLYSALSDTLYSIKVTGNAAAGDGGGVYGDSLVLVNALVTNNKITSSTGRGAGLYLNHKSVLVNNTIAYNRTNGGSGAGIYAKNSEDNTTLLNSIVWGNKKVNTPDQIILENGIGTQFTYNAIQALPSSMPSRTNIDLHADNFGSDSTRYSYPFFMCPSENVEQANWNLVLSSSCIDAGTNVGQRVNFGTNDSIILPTNDVEGHRRVAHNKVDLGALENLFGQDLSYKVVFVVPSPGTGRRDGTSWCNATDNLSLATAMASTLHIDNDPAKDHPSVWVAGGTYRVDTTTATSSILMHDDAQVYGGFYGYEPIDLSLYPLYYDMAVRPLIGNSVLEGYDNHRVLLQPEPFDSLTRWDGFTIRYGKAVDGAGAYLQKNGLLSHCTFTDNVATGKGGAVFAEDQAYLIDNKYQRNSAANGGAVYAVNSVISRSSFVNNEATSNGGGIYANGVNIINSEIAENEGGGIYAENNSRIISATVVNNQVSSVTSPIATGSGILCENGTMVLNTLLWGNQRAGSTPFENQMTKSVGNVSYSAIQGDLARAGSNHNISLEEQNNRLIWRQNFNYPELYNIADDNFAIHELSSVISLGDPNSQTIVSNLNLPEVDYTKDLAGNARMLHGSIDIGAFEHNTPVKHHECFDTICLGTIGLVVTCDGHVLHVPDDVVQTAGEQSWGDTLWSAGTCHIYWVNIKVNDNPLLITASDTTVCTDAHPVLIDRIAGFESGDVQYWSIDGNPYSTSTPANPMVPTQYSFYCQTLGNYPCTSDTVDFQILFTDIDITDDAIDVCIDDSKALGYVPFAEGYWGTLDASIATCTDGIVTGNALGTTKIYYKNDNCGSDTVVVTVRERPHIVQPDTIVDITKRYYFTISPDVPGTWASGDDNLATVDGSQGIFAPNDTGIVYLYYIGPYGCTDSIQVTIVDTCGCSFQMSHRTADIRAFATAVNTGGLYTPTMGANAGQTFSAENGFAGCKITMGNNNNSIITNWIPIGTVDHPFKGFLDASTRSICRLDNSSTPADTMAFFGYVENAHIKGIRIAGDYAKDPVNAPVIFQGRDLVAGVVAYAKNSIIENVYSGPMLFGDNIVGGVVGVAENCTIRSCLNVATITGKNGPIGGIVGRAVNTKIEDCINSGWIKNANLGTYMGGICGETDDTIQNCIVNNCVGTPPHTSPVDNMAAIAAHTLPGAVIDNCFYDNQLCPLPNIQVGNAAHVTRTEGIATNEMLGWALEPSLGNEKWYFMDKLNPQIIYFSDAVSRSMLSAESASTLLLPAGETVDHASSFEDLLYLSDPNNESANSVAIKDPFSILSCTDELKLRQYTRGGAAYTNVNYAALKQIPVYINNYTYIKVYTTNTMAYHDDTVEICKANILRMTAYPADAHSYHWSYRAGGRGTHAFFNINDAQTLQNIASLSETNEGWYIVTTDVGVCESKDSVYIEISPAQLYPAVTVVASRDGVQFPVADGGDVLDLAHVTIRYEHPKPAPNSLAGCPLNYRISYPNTGVVVRDWTEWSDTSQAITVTEDELDYGLLRFELQHSNCPGKVCGEPLLFSHSMNVVNRTIHIHGNPDESFVCWNFDSVRGEHIFAPGLETTDEVMLMGYRYARNGYVLDQQFDRQLTVLGQDCDTVWGGSRAPTWLESGFLNEDEFALLLPPTSRLAVKKTPNGITTQANDVITIFVYSKKIENVNELTTPPDTTWSYSDTVAVQWRILNNPRFSTDPTFAAWRDDVAGCYGYFEHNSVTFGAFPEIVENYPEMDTVRWFYSENLSNGFIELNNIDAGGSISGLFAYGRSTVPQEGIDLVISSFYNYPDTIYFKPMLYSHSSACPIVSDTIRLIGYGQMNGGKISAANDHVCYNTPATVLSVVDGTGGNPADNQYRWQYSLNGISFYDAPGISDQKNYTSENLQEEIAYARRIYEGNCGKTYSDTITINIALHYNFLFSDAICKGEVYDGYGFHIDTRDSTTGAKIYRQDLLTRDLHCDSTVQLKLVIYDSAKVSLPAGYEICPGTPTTVSAVYAADSIAWYQNGTFVSANHADLNLSPTENTICVAEAINSPRYFITGDAPTVADIHVGDLVNDGNAIIPQSLLPDILVSGILQFVPAAIVFDVRNDSVFMVHVKEFMAQWGPDSLVGANNPYYSIPNINAVSNFIANTDYFFDATDFPAFNDTRQLVDFYYGDWFLPSMHDLINMYSSVPLASFNDNDTISSVGGNWDNKNIINQTVSYLIQIQPDIADSVYLTDGGYWSSMESDRGTAWNINRTGCIRSINKNMSAQIRPIRAELISELHLVSRGTNVSIAKDTTLITVTPNPVRGKVAPTDSTICYGIRPNAFRSEADADRGTIEWQQSPDGISFVAADGTHNQQTYAYPGTLTTTTYFRRAVDGTCTTLYSDTIKITVAEPIISGTITPADTNICYNGSLNAFRSVSDAAGGTGMNILWQQSVDGLTWTPAAGINNEQTYTYPYTLTDDIYFRRFYSGACGATYSNLISVHVANTALVGSVAPTDTTITYNTYANPFRSTQDPSGGVDMIIRWEKSLNGSIWTAADGINNLPAYTLTTPLTEETYFRRAYIGSCGTLYSGTIHVLINARAEAGEVAPSDTTICYNTQPFAFRNVSNPTDGGIIEWQYSTDGINFTPAPGLNNQLTYAYPNNLTNTTYFRRKVTFNGEDDYSNQITVTVLPALVGGEISNTNDTICTGTIPAEIRELTPASGGDMNYTYTWQFSTNRGAVWNDIPASNSINYTPTALTDTTWFRRKVTDGRGMTQYTDVYQVFVPEINASNFTISCAADIDVTLKYGQCDTLLTIGQPATTYPIDGWLNPLTRVPAAPHGNRYPSGNSAITWTASDICGNTRTCVQVVNVQYPPCSGTVSDYDGNNYPMVRVGCDCWLGKNLNTTHYSDGRPVAVAKNYNDNPAYSDIYGKLYSWYSTVDLPEESTERITGTCRGLCPEGWRIPTTEDYRNLMIYAGDEQSLRSPDYWVGEGRGTSPADGFNILPAGFYNSEIGTYQFLLTTARFWTTETTTTTTIALDCRFNYDCPDLTISESHKKSGFSVRCIRAY